MALYIYPRVVTQHGRARSPVHNAHWLTPCDHPRCSKIIKAFHTDMEASDGIGRGHNVSSMAWNRCVLAPTLFVIYLAAMLENMPVEPLIERWIIVLKYSKRPPKMSSLHGSQVAGMAGRLQEVPFVVIWLVGEILLFLEKWSLNYERWSLMGSGRTGRFNINHRENVEFLWGR